MFTADRISLSEKVYRHLLISGSASLAEIGELFVKSSSSEEIIAQFVCPFIEEDTRLDWRDNKTVILSEQGEKFRELYTGSYAAIDVETTGLTLPSNRVTEIGIVFIDEGKVTGRWESLINPERYVPPTIARKTGITNEMVFGSPHFHELAELILKKIEGRRLIAHNAPFDMRFLKNEFYHASGIQFETPMLCSLKMARLLMPGLKKYTLESLAALHGLQFSRLHRAGEDAAVLAELFIKFLPEFCKNDIFSEKDMKIFQIE